MYDGDEDDEDEAAGPSGDPGAAAAAANIRSVGGSFETRVSCDSEVG